MSTTLNMITLRPGMPADIATIDRIMQRAFDPRFGEAWTRGQCLGILAMPGVWLTLAALNGDVAGFALARAIAGEAELLLLACLPEVRRRGVGGALLRSVINDAQDRNATKIYLEVRRGNEALDLYRSSGFLKVGERLAYYRGTSGQLYDALTFERQLA
ncbi:MAG: ribosomal-protein-alanine acetyltransferase [Sphingomonas sp. 28-62-20]|uniref:GNAT family N-acetyltransferase n=1 Tax=unclassified Sphingomonas TaxID=196159 RepID=UPI000BD7A8F3|nr:GNAT family N-acetyltransferase [Sphingomonas sp.]OYY77350.1 MAG: ribosomal-protein-alanine acetyltransferase [Sphingomonas sp. 28-62-20]